VLNLAYNNLAREVWLESKLDPHVPTFTTIMQCSISIVGVFETPEMFGQKRADLARVGGVESMSRSEGQRTGVSIWSDGGLGTVASFED
jgi:acetyl-CoA C-acetyltransferase